MAQGAFLDSLGAIKSSLPQTLLSKVKDEGQVIGGHGGGGSWNNIVPLGIMAATRIYDKRRPLTPLNQKLEGGS